MRAALRRNRIWIAGVVLLASIAACSPAGRTSTLDRARETGSVRIGYANEAPFAYQDVATGELTGEAPAIARAVAAELGIPRVEGVLTEFGSLIPGLLAGRFDMIAAGMYITPERCRQVAFSEPTYSIGEALIVAGGNPKQLHGYDDIRDDATATMGVVSGAIQRQYARAAGIADSRILSFPDPPAALAGVRTGRVDSYAATSLTINTLLAKTTAHVERADPFHDVEVDGQPVRGYGAFAVRRDDTEWLNAVNGVLAEFIGTDAHRRLVEPFGFGADLLPGAVTTRMLCGEDGSAN